MKSSIKYFLLLLSTVIIQPLFAQKIVSSNGEANVRVELNMSVDEAYEMAEQLAKIDAIEKAFGTYTEQQMDMTITDGQTSYDIIGTTKVLGEWIETTKINFTENFNTEDTKYGRRDVKYIKCSIRGKVRKSIAKAKLEHEILNAPYLYARTTAFLNDEQLYIYLKSPVDGFLSIYLDDGTNAFRLLPDTYSPELYRSGVYIKGDLEYFFFTPNRNNLPQADVEEYLMFTNKEIEYNKIHIVFSEEKFVKPILKGKEKAEGKVLPKSLTTKKFKEWLSENHASSESFQDIMVKVSIQ